MHYTQQAMSTAGLLSLHPLAILAVLCKQKKMKQRDKMKQPTAQIAHLFFSNAQCQKKKQKSYFCPTLKMV